MTDFPAPRENSWPTDLQPIPTQPWDERPSSLPLDVEEVRTALWLERGNVTNSALRLKVTSARLRRFIDSSPRLQAEQREAREQLLDRAEEIVHEALNDPADPGRRDGMTKFLLNSAMAKQRGYGSGPSTQVNVKNTGPMIIGWLTEEKAMPGDTARDVTPQEAAE